MKIAASNRKTSARERTARFLAKLVFFLLLALIALVAIPYGTVEPWWEALFECVVFGLTALWMIEGFLSGAWNPSSYRMFWPLLGLAALALLQTVPTGVETNIALKVGGIWQAISADPHGTRRWVSKLLALILMAAMLRSYTDTTRRLRTLVRVVIAVALASAVFGLLRQMTQHEAGFFLPYLKPGFGYAQFINKNHFPFLMEMALGLVMGLALAEGVRREWLLIYASLGLLLAGALVSANSRGGVLSLCCQMLFAALVWPTVRRASQAGAAPGGRALMWARRAGRSLPVRALLLVCLIAVMVVGIVWVGGDALVGNLEALPTEVGQPAEGIRWSVRRRDIWPATWQLIREHPLVGSGFGAYWMAITEYHQASGEKTPQEAHNDYLEFLAGGGAAGLILGGWFGYLFIRRARASLRREGDAFGRSVCFGALVGLSGVIVHSFVDFGLHITINSVIFFTLLGLATATTRQEVVDRQVYRQ